MLRQKNRSKPTKAEERLREYLAVQARPIASGSYRELQGTPVTKAEIWRSIQESRDPFLEELVKGFGSGIGAIEHAGLLWRRVV